jgi:hypothetical protein
MGRDNQDARSILSACTSFELFGSGKGHSELWWKALFYQIMDVDEFISCETRLAGKSSANGRDFTTYYFVYTVTEAGRQYLLKCELPLVLVHATKTYPQYSSDLRCTLLRQCLHEELKIRQRHEKKLQEKDRRRKSSRVDPKKIPGMLDDDAVEGEDTLPSQVQNKQQHRKKQRLSEGAQVDTSREVDGEDSELRSSTKSKKPPPHPTKYTDLHSKHRNERAIAVLKQARQAICDRKRLNVPYVLSNKELPRVVEALVTEEFVSGDGDVPDVTGLATPIIELLGWDDENREKIKIARKLAKALLREFHPVDEEEEHVAAEE